MCKKMVSHSLHATRTVCHSKDVAAKRLDSVSSPGASATHVHIRSTQEVKHFFIVSHSFRPSCHACQSQVMANYAWKIQVAWRISGDGTLLHLLQATMTVCHSNDIAPIIWQTVPSLGASAGMVHGMYFSTQKSRYYEAHLCCIAFLPRFIPSPRVKALQMISGTSKSPGASAGMVHWIAAAALPPDGGVPVLSLIRCTTSPRGPSTVML